MLKIVVLSTLILAAALWHGGIQAAPVNVSINGLYLEADPGDFPDQNVSISYNPENSDAILDIGHGYLVVEALPDPEGYNQTRYKLILDSGSQFISPVDKVKNVRQYNATANGLPAYVIREQGTSGEGGENYQIPAMWTSAIMPLSNHMVIVQSLSTVPIVWYLERIKITDSRNVSAPKAQMPLFISSFFGALPRVSGQNRYSISRRVG
ncbi:MAG TPA: hypothetical protein VN455_14835 [Methanotrichaceae archaeon]|nr:hypothetical protein [Methanotrichaceae archaeon]